MDAYNEYAKRLGAYCRLELVELPESTLDKEATAVLKYFDKNAYIISMAIEGKKLSSEGLAEMLNRCAVSGKSKIWFAIQTFITSAFH